MQPSLDPDTRSTYLEVQGANGVIYDLYELPHSDWIARDGNWIVHRSRQSEPPIFVEQVSRKGVVFEVCHARRPLQGPWASGPSVRGFQVEGFRRLRSFPDEVFLRGQIASQDLNDAYQMFEPVSDGWECVPSLQNLSDNPDIVTATICDRRFSRWSDAAIAERKAAREAAARAERERKAAEAETARLKREERERQAEEAHRLAEQAKFDAWHASLPLPPGTLVVDIQDEINPCLGRVEYDGLYQDQDGGWCFSGTAENLPKFIKINYGHRPKPEFLIERRGLKEQFIPYEGSGRSLGTRIARTDALNGRPDPFPPRHGDLVFATIDFTGKGYTPDIGEGFVVEHALEFLSRKAPYQSGFVTVSHDDGDFDGERDGGQRTSRERVSQSLEERYPDLFRYDARSGCYVIRGDNTDSPWRDYQWGSHDKKLLEAEERRRIAENAEWDKRRKALLHLMKVLGADLSQIDASEHFGGAMCKLVLTEAELDTLEAFLRSACDCEASIGYSRDELNRELVGLQVLPPGLLDDVLKIWREYRGSGPLFISATDHLVADAIEPGFVIEGMLMADAVTLLVGPAKLGKSTVALQMAMAVASGEPFAALRVESGKAAYLYGEGTEASFRKQRRDANFSSDKLLAINARSYNDQDMERALDDALDDLEGHPELRLLVLDALEAFVPNSSDSNAIYRITNRLAAFAERSGAGVLVIHHDTKDVTAENATSARQVATKTKGSGRIGNAARAKITLHRKGENRVLTLMDANIPLTVSRLQTPLEFAVDYETGLWRVVSKPVVAAGKVASATPRKPSSPESKIDRPSLNCVEDGDAREAAAIVNRLQGEMGRKIAFAGAKSLYALKGTEGLRGWTRARCERAHRRAVEIGEIETI